MYIRGLNDMDLRMQVKVIRDIFRVGNYSRKEFDVKELNGICGLSNDEPNPCTDAITYLQDKGAIQVVETDNITKVVLVSYDVLMDALLNC